MLDAVLLICLHVVTGASVLDTSVFDARFVCSSRFSTIELLKESLSSQTLSFTRLSSDKVNPSGTMTTSHSIFLLPNSERLLL